MRALTTHNGNRMAISGRQERRSAFTLVELMMALAVTAIISLAVTSLAFALSSATAATDATGVTQSQLRLATVRLRQLIKYSSLICGLPGDDAVIWTGDSDSDNQIDPAELVYIEAGASRNYIRLLEFTGTGQVTLSDIQSGQAKSDLLASFAAKYTTLVESCSNVAFLADVAPPQTRRLSITFELSENDGLSRYQITGVVRAFAGNLLSESGQILSGDDD